MRLYHEMWQSERKKRLNQSILRVNQMIRLRKYGTIPPTQFDCFLIFCPNWSLFKLPRTQQSKTRLCLIFSSAQPLNMVFCVMFFLFCQRDTINIAVKCCRSCQWFLQKQSFSSGIIIIATASDLIYVVGLCRMVLQEV